MITGMWRADRARSLSKDTSRSWWRLLLTRGVRASGRGRVRAGKGANEACELSDSTRVLTEVLPSHRPGVVAAGIDLLGEDSKSFPTFGEMGRPLGRRIRGERKEDK